MEYQANINSEELNIQRLLSSFLSYKVSSENISDESVHLDEDSLSAFVEGSLGRVESQPVIIHLVDCSFCRNVTSELIKLDLAFAEEESLALINDKSTSKISQVLSSVLSRIFGTNDDAVFAHQEKEEEAEKSDDKVE